MLKKIILSEQQAEQAESEGWGVFELDVNGTDLQLQKSDEADVFKDDEDAWLYVIEQAKKGSGLHGYVINAFKNEFPKEFALYAKDVTDIPDAESNKNRVFIVSDGSDAFVYSDNSQWASVDGELCTDDNYGYPVWPEGEPVNGKFIDEDFELYQFKMIAATNAYSLMEDDLLVFSEDSDDMDENCETIDSLSMTYGSSLSKAIGLDLDAATNYIREHLQSVIPEG